MYIFDYLRTSPETGKSINHERPPAPRHQLTANSESEENFTRKYKLKSRGFNFEKVVDRVSLLFRLEKDYITGKGRQKDRVQARDLVCYWCAIELGISMADLAKRLGITLSAVSYAVKRGEEIAKESDYLLED